jgi:hypothetical protein
MLTIEIGHVYPHILGLTFLFALAQFFLSLIETVVFSKAKWPLNPVLS